MNAKLIEEFDLSALRIYNICRDSRTYLKKSAGKLKY